MYNKQLFWLGFLATLGIVMMTASVKAETNQSDTSGGQTYSSPTVSIDSINGNGISNIIQFDPVTGTFFGGGLETPISFGSGFGSGSGSGFGNGLGNGTGVGTGTGTGTGIGTGTGTGNSESGDGGTTATGEDNGNVADGSVECSTKNCLAANGNQPKQITLNDLAKLLADNLNDSLDNLAAAEKSGQLANAAPRRIARRGTLSDLRTCPNPAIEAREIVEKQLDESQKFIQQVNHIETQKNIW
ncbi:MAG: hypothetical protein ACRC80_34760 [Waterburya sp.]